MRTYIKKIEEAIASGNAEEAKSALKEAQPKIMSVAQKGIFHKNTASRKISRLAKKVKNIS
jgi:small subunit ribosomal protein S20